MMIPQVKKISSFMFKLYIAWSICADILLIVGVIALLIGDLKISF